MGRKPAHGIKGRQSGDGSSCDPFVEIAPDTPPEMYSDVSGKPVEVNLCLEIRSLMRSLSCQDYLFQDAALRSRLEEIAPISPASCEMSRETGARRFCRS